MYIKPIKSEKEKVFGESNFEPFISVGKQLMLCLVGLDGIPVAMIFFEPEETLELKKLLNQKI